MCQALRYFIVTAALWAQLLSSRYEWENEGSERLWPVQGPTARMTQDSNSNPETLEPKSHSRLHWAFEPMVFQPNCTSSFFLFNFGPQPDFYNTFDLPLQPNLFPPSPFSVKWQPKNLSICRPDGLSVFNLKQLSSTFPYSHLHPTWGHRVGEIVSSCRFPRSSRIISFFLWYIHLKASYLL